MVKRKVLLSVMTIAVVGILVAGGAYAYFCDSEGGGSHDIVAGTIDIEVDGENPWEGAVTKDFPVDFKPCMTGTIDFVVTNVGSNPAVVWKHVTVTERTGGEQSYLAPDQEYYSSEPEWEAEVAGRVDNLDAVINYDLVSAGGVECPGSGVVFVDEDSVTMEKVDCMWMPLGTVLPGQSLQVHQSYHIQPTAGNEYQGDTVTFSIDLWAEQRLGPGPAESPNNKLFLDNKTCWDNWDFIADDTWALLEYNEQSVGDFTYNLRANHLNPNKYHLVWYDEVSGTETVLVSDLAPDVDGNIVSSGSTGVAVGDNAKIWLRAADYNNVDTLWESNLIYQV
jgi:hypothetical protein